MQLRTAFTIVVVVLAFLGATCSNPTPPPPVVCESAQVCAVQRTTQDKDCKFQGPGSSDLFYIVQNEHPQRKIYATYMATVRHLNSNRPPESSYGSVSADPNKTGTLGCQRTKGVLAEQFDEWSFTIVSACFANECPSPPMKNPDKTRDPRKTCEELCDEDDQSCLKYTLNGSAPIERRVKSSLDQLNRSLISVQPPASVHVDPLVAVSNAYTGSNQCSRTDLVFSSPNSAGEPSFYNTGSSCPIGVSLSDPRVSAFEISFPGDLSGNAQLSNGQSYSLVPTDDNHSPKLLITEKASGSRVEEPILLWKGRSSSTMTFTGKKYYCAQLKWEGD